MNRRVAAAGEMGRALVVGWFSFREGGATAGDLEVCDVVRTWARDEGFEVDVALAPPLRGGVDWRTVLPSTYSHLVVACGPVWPGSPFEAVCERFRAARTIGVNVSLPHGAVALDAVVERDGGTHDRPDLSLLGDVEQLPVVGVLRAPDQAEYEGRTMHREALHVIRDAIEIVGVAAVPLSTVLTDPRGGLASPGAVESVIARMDAVVTMRLHGLVLALKHGVPAVAIDQVEGGAKVARQAAVLGWPHVHVAGSLLGEQVAESLRRCLEPEARALARQCAAAARVLADAVRSEVVAALAPGEAVASPSASRPGRP